ncbi:MAG: hypothetical protein ACRDN0_09280 [Trebonia sp.]
MDYKLQVATLPVSDVDKAKTLCTEKAGFTLDVDYGPAADFRVVQLTPHGPACSGIGLTDPAPGLNACGHNATVGEPAGWRPVYADAEIASVGRPKPRRANSTAKTSGRGPSRGSRTPVP